MYLPYTNRCMPLDAHVRYLDITCPRRPVLVLHAKQAGGEGCLCHAIREIQTFPCCVTKQIHHTGSGPGGMGNRLEEYPKAGWPCWSCVCHATEYRTCVSVLFAFLSHVYYPFGQGISCPATNCVSYCVP